MITKEQAMKLRHGDEVWHLYGRNVDGTPLRARVNGKIKLWKTRPHDFQLPMKQGLYNCFYLQYFAGVGVTERNNFMFALPSEFAEQAVNLKLEGHPIGPANI